MVNTKIQKVAPVMLSVASCIGVIFTSVLIAKETLENSDKLKEALETKEPKKIIKTCAKVYWPSMISCGSSLAALITGTVISKRYEASLSTTALMATTAFNKYRGKVKEILGNDTDKEINEKISEDDYKQQKQQIDKLSDGLDGTRLYWEAHVGYFEANPEKLAKAFITAQNRIRFPDYEDNGTKTDNWVSLRVLLDDAGAKLINKEYDDVSLDYGWHYDYMNDVYFGDLSLDYTSEPKVDKDGKVLYHTLVIDKEPVFGVPRDPFRFSGGYDVNQIDENVDPLEEEIMNKHAEDIK